MNFGVKLKLLNLQVKNLLFWKNFAPKGAGAGRAADRHRRWRLAARRSKRHQAQKFFWLFFFQKK
jgi:hypothetical protein